jgi:hypothetical protein
MYYDVNKSQVYSSCMYVNNAQRDCDICSTVRVSICLSSHFKSRKTEMILIKFDINFMMPFESPPNMYLLLNFLQ